MKIQCDVCNKRDASLFCTADEAALCDTCDHRIHHANKLASKHQRFSLNNPSPNNSPLCDICHERRGFIFCQEDRAILCKECDFPIHSANEHTKNHNRFLLTGIKISLDSLPPISNSTSLLTPPKPSSPDSLSTVNKTNEEGAANFTSSSISEYLINTIPGWQFEDFITDSPSVPFQTGFSPSESLVSFSTDGIWVPQAPSMDQQHKKIGTKESTNTKKGRSRSKLRDDNFLVPQMMSPSTPTPNKRSRFLW